MEEMKEERKERRKKKVCFTSPYLIMLQLYIIQLYAKIFFKLGDNLKYFQVIS